MTRIHVTLLFALLLAVLLSACTLVRMDLGPRSAPFLEKTVSGEGPDKVALIDVSGLLIEGAVKPSGGLPWSKGSNLVARIAEELDTVRADRQVKAVVLKINSPGGTVAASDLIHHEIMRLKKDRGIKVTAVLTSIAASGGYYVATAADRIICLPTTMTGSIGVIAVKFDFSGLMSRYGVGAEVVKSGPLKDMWSPFRRAGEEEYKAMQGMIDEMFDRFRDAVRAGRPEMTDEQFRLVSTGEVMPASKARRLGLVDEIGYPEDAIEAARKMAGLEKARVVVYHRPGGYRPNVYAKGAEIDGDSTPDILSLTASPQLMYLWLPGIQ